MTIKIKVFEFAILNNLMWNCRKRYGGKHVLKRSITPEAFSSSTLRIDNLNKEERLLIKLGEKTYVTTIQILTPTSHHAQKWLNQHRSSKVHSKARENTVG